MKKALVIKRNGDQVMAEYAHEERDRIFTELQCWRTVTIGRKTFPVDTIEMIEWID